MKQSELVSMVSDTTERFNKDLIYSRNQDVKGHIEDICKALEVLEYIEFLGCEINHDESDLGSRVSINNSRLSECTISFKCTLKDETAIVKKKFFIPKLIDNFFFILNDVRYFPIWQIVDKGVYVTSKTYSLKTTLMPIRFSYKRKVMVDYFGDDLKIYEFKLNLFKKQLNMLIYFFAEFGIIDTAKFFGYSVGEKGDIFLFKDSVAAVEEGTYGSSDMYYFFNVKKIWVRAKKKSFDSYEGRSFISAFASEILDKKRIDDSVDVWKKMLGGTFTKSTNNQTEKAEKVIFSLKRILDERTKKLLTDIDDKNDIFCILRWMFMNFPTNQHLDNMHLSRKRVQSWEYLLFPLQKLFSAASYRITNTRTVTLKTLVSIFNIQPNFLIKRLLTNELLRYSSCTNNMDLFGSALKVTFKGVGGLAGSSDVPEKLRKVHPSYINKFSLMSTSASEPGLTTTLTPFTELVDGEFVFDEQPSIRK